MGPDIQVPAMLIAISLPNLGDDGLTVSVSMSRQRRKAGALSRSGLVHSARMPMRPYYAS